MIIDTVIETPRLALRILEEDAASGPYLSWMNDADVLRYLEARHTTHTEESLRSFINSVRADDGALMMSIHLKDAGATQIGNIKLGEMDRRNGRCEMGVIIGAKEQWGMGLAPEAIGAMTRYAFDELGLKRVTATICSGNDGSVRAFLKAGFIIEGRMRDYWRFDDGYQDEVMLGCLPGDLQA